MAIDGNVSGVSNKDNFIPEDNLKTKAKESSVNKKTKTMAKELKEKAVQSTQKMTDKNIRLLNLQKELAEISKSLSKPYPNLGENIEKLCVDYNEMASMVDEEMISGESIIEGVKGIYVSSV